VGEARRKDWRDYRGDIIAGLIVAVLTASSAPWWWPPLHDALTNGHDTGSQIVGFSGACAPYRVVAQNRWQPYGTTKRAAPDIMSNQVGGYAPNQVIPVDGWVHSSVAYPTNKPPWNSDIWFHVADGSGWVSYAGVRELPTIEDPTGFAADGGQPPVTPEPRHGAVH
jgi:hypothetical protein